MILQALAKKWWLLLLRGIVAVLFGILAFAWPGITLVTLVIFYGAYALIDGIVALAAAIGGGAMTPRWWLAIVGIAGIAAGLITFFWPGITALVLITLIGAWMLAHGVLEIIGAIKLRHEIDNEWLLIISGAVSVVVGLFVLAQPGAGALAFVWLIAAYAIAFGLLMIGLSLRLKKHLPATA
ncbi:MAG TPA: HdeD family acid-resistance protein [Candidatus Binatia bacterium]